MTRHAMATAMLGIALFVQPVAEAGAAMYAVPPFTGSEARLVERIQDGPRRDWHRDWHRDWRRGPGPQAYPGWRGGPGWRGAAPWRGPVGWSGRPYWYGRPWVARPYYGTIIAGVALGTLITVAAVGLVPARPAPHLCWYWADPYGERGYWDYCG
jgi:hypothetical protein